MKWLPRRGSINSNTPEKKNYRRNFFSSPQILKLLICLAFTGVFLSGDVSKLTNQIFASNSSQKPTTTEIDDIAGSISVKVISEDFLGSGFIVLQEQGIYTVVTNQHVLRAGKAPYSLQTPDGKIHSATIPSSSSLISPKYDLAILEFIATDVIYPTAKVGNSIHLEVGEPIYAAGFPYSEFKPKKSSSAIANSLEFNQDRDFVIKSGRVAIILSKALEEGYQIGYTNDVKKGMSGGPLLNNQGEVIGINGKHAYPLWESAEFYQDGTQPCPELQKLITRSSLAIPIEKSIELSPKLQSLRPVNTVESSRKSNWSDKNSKVVTKMQLEAERTSKSCQQ